MFRDRKLFFSDSDPCRSLTNTGLQAGVTPQGTLQPFQPEPPPRKDGIKKTYGSESDIKEEVKRCKRGTVTEHCAGYADE